MNARNLEPHMTKQKIQNKPAPKKKSTTDISASAVEAPRPVALHRLRDHLCVAEVFAAVRPIA